MISKVEYSNLVNIIKGIKHDRIIITPTKVIGIGDFVSEVLYDTKFNNIREINAQVAKDIEAYVTDNDNIYDIIIRNSIYVKDLDMIEYLIQDINRRDVSYIIGNIKTDDRFTRTYSMKAADGSTMIIINDRYCISSFKGMLPINKADNASLDIIDYDNTTFIGRFVIDKKKYKITKYIRYLYI